MLPIFITCLGGTGSSLTSRIFTACGMEDGNDNTYYVDRYRTGSAQHDLLTALVHMYGQEDRFDMKWRLRGVWAEWEMIHKNEPGSIEDKIKHILHRYVVEADRRNWKSYGVKIDTIRKMLAGFGRYNKNVIAWKEVHNLVASIWGENTVTVSTIRDPISYIERLFADPRFLPTQGEHMVQYADAIPAWKLVLKNGGIVIPYPQAFDDGTIKDYVKEVGLQWHPKADAIYQKGKPTRMEQSKINEFYNSFALAEKTIKGYNDIVKSIGRKDCIIPTTR